MELRLFLKGAYLLLGFLPLSCHTSDPVSDRLNIVWITSEDNSKHYLSLFDSNGVETPNIEKLAAHGLRFTRAFSNAPVCSVARSTLITGCYAPRIGAQFHRKLEPVKMPEHLKMFPAYLRSAGYYTTNNRKEDYNIVKTEDVWDESSGNATWKNRAPNQPFFHVINFTTTHESSLHFSKGDMSDYIPTISPQKMKPQPNHPDTKLFKYTQSFYLDKIAQMDQEVGQVVNELEKEGLLENTIVFYFGDHGGVLPGSKGYVYETGLHVPLVVYIPDKYKYLTDGALGSTVSGFVSFVDFGPTVLHLAGIELPAGLDGKPFLGSGITMKQINSRDEAFSYADRFDEKYDLVRALRKGDLKYVRSYQPFNYDGLMNNYRYQQLAYQEWDSLYQSGNLNAVQAQFFQPRSPEMLFDLKSDPFETRNLSADPGYQTSLKELRKRLQEILIQEPDLSFYPEHYLIDSAWNNPVDFGQMHKENIQSYLETADLALLSFEQAGPLITQRLASPDPWQRYWALIVSSSLGKSAISLKKSILTISETDNELINRVRAAECLAIMNVPDTEHILVDALYKTTRNAEALLILNSVVLLRDGYGKKFIIKSENIVPTVRENSEVQRRLQYLNLL